MQQKDEFEPVLLAECIMLCPAAAMIPGSRPGAESDLAILAFSGPFLLFQGLGGLISSETLGFGGLAYSAG